MSTGSVLFVCSPDTDVVMLLLHYCSQFAYQTLFDTGVANRHLVNDIQQVIRYDVAQALPALHAFTGCDAVSAFIQKGKTTPYHIAKGNMCILETLKILGLSPDFVSEDTHMELRLSVHCMDFEQD